MKCGRLNEIQVWNRDMLSVKCTLEPRIGSKMVAPQAKIDRVEDEEAIVKPFRGRGREENAERVHAKLRYSR